VIKGKRYLSHEVTQTLPDDVARMSHNNAPGKKVLELIATGKTSNEIAQQLFVSITTINTHRKSLLAKIYLNNTVH